MLYLDPRIKKGGYTIEEDRTILSLQKDLGNRWNKITLCFPRRTENDIKARFRVLQRTGFNGGGNCTKYPPSSRKAEDNRTSLRQVAAKALRFLHVHHEAAVSLPKPGEPFVEGDTMDTSKVPYWKGHLHLMNSNGFAVLLDNSYQVVWSEAPQCTSPARAAASWEKNTSYVVGSSSPCGHSTRCSFEEFGDKSESTFFEGLKALGVAADLKTSGSLSGTKRHGWKGGESSKFVLTSDGKPGPNVLMPKDDDSNSSTPTKQQEEEQQQVRSNSNRSPLFSSVFNSNSMAFIAKKQPQPVLRGMKEDSLHMQSGGGCDLTTNKNHLKIMPQMLPPSFIPV